MVRRWLRPQLVGDGLTGDRQCGVSASGCCAGHPDNDAGEIRLHFGFDPGFGALIDFAFAHPGCIEGRADADGDRAGFLEEGLARPEFAGVVGDRHHLAADLRRQVGAASLVAFFLAGRDARTFGEDDDVEALLQPLAALG
jgi:hypothetical protein